MLKIDGTNILLTRGDECTITLKVNREDSEEYAFNVGDVISFAVYNKKEFNKEPLLLKEVTVQEPTNIVDIFLESNETKIGIMDNKQIIYWYEIQLNHSQTIVGYDDKGPKILILYPEGGNIE